MPFFLNVTFDYFMMNRTEQSRWNTGVRNTESRHSARVRQMLVQLYSFMLRVRKVRPG